MNPLNKKPIEVDFNNCDKDGAIRLHLPVTIKTLKEKGVSLEEGMLLSVTDREIEITGKVTFREPFWVVIPDENVFHEVIQGASNN